MVRLLVCLCVALSGLTAQAAQECVTVSKNGTGWDTKYLIDDWSGLIRGYRIIPLNRDVEALLATITTPEKICIEGSIAPNYRQERSVFVHTAYRAR